jgi:branched-chain amino acid transport system ATP-binding protein
MAELLITEGLRAGYGRIPVLAGISLGVGSGEFVGILGHNGMGKTTLLKALMGVLPATAGAIRFDGAPITALATHRRARLGIGYVPQGREIFPRLSVQENLTFAAGSGRDALAAVETVIEDFPRLKPLLERAGGALSGGEQQLLALARCLVQRPRLVLLDEPTEGIQPSIIDEIVDRLQALRSRRGLTMMLVEQNVDFIRALSDRVLVMQKGSIVQELRPDRLSDAVAMGEFAAPPAEGDSRMQRERQ